ncbi:MAG: hypothetical protein Q8L14_31420 [Myxococcales bacterium]|nr:hypothetical protein [Myxococcales bacterium]
MLTLLTSSLVAASPLVLVDGVRVEGTQVSAGSMIVNVSADLRLWLPTNQEWRLSTERSEPEGSLLVFDQRRALVGASLVPATVAPPRYLEGRNLKSLRGLAVNGWGAGLERLMGTLPPAACLSLAGVPSGLKPGALPAALPCLAVSSQDPIDLVRFKKLEWLDVGANGALAVLPEKLKVLTVRHLRVEASALARLEGLVSLAVHDTDSLELESSFRVLERLRVENVAKVSIAKLNAPRLRTLDLRRSHVKALDLEAPLLEEAVLLDIDSPSDVSAGFANAHPAVPLIKDWTAFLRHTFRDADRLRVRAGGLGGVPASEPVLELNTAAEVQALLRSTELEAGGPLFLYCMCPGDPFLEFFRNSVRIDTIMLHHGLRIRWDEHPGDIELATDGLVRFLASRGLKKPLEDVLATAPARKAEAELRRARRALIPAPLLPLFDQGAVPELLTVLKKHSADRTEFVGLLLRLRAANPLPRGAPDADFGFRAEGPLDRALETVTADDVIAVAKSPRAAETERALSWLLLTPRPPDFAREPRVQALMVQLSRAALSSPSARARVDAIASLFDNQSDAALVALRQLVEGDIQISNGAETAGEASAFDFVVLLRSMLPPHDRLEERDPRILAAWALVLRRAPGARALVERLLDDVTGPDADLLRAALRKLNAM